MLVGYISSLSILLPFLLGLILFKKIDFNQKCFFFYIILSIFIEAYTSYLNFKGIDNSNPFKVYLVGELFFFLWFFNRSYKTPIWFFSIAGLVFCTIGFVEFCFAYKYVSKTFNYSFIVLFTFFIFQSAYTIIKTFEENDVSFNRNYFFWIAFARLFYFLTILFIFIYPNFVQGLENEKLYSYAFATINTVGNILMNLLYSFSFICKRLKI